MAIIKERLDILVQEQFPHLTRNQIQSFIMQGKVLVDGKPCVKAGTKYALDVRITLQDLKPRYVSRAGFKLEKALEHFKIETTGKTALDAGISTGGFTDCLLQHGIAKVYGVDVGYGQVHESIMRDSKVVIMERTNLRNLTALPELVDIVTLDLSFISVLKVMDTIKRILKPGGDLIILVKPQFEARKEQVARGGIVKDPAVHAAVVHNVVTGITAEGFDYKGVIDSPLLGTMGNKEMLAHFVKQ